MENTEFQVFEKKKLGILTRMIGTVLKISLSLVDYINKQLFISHRPKKVVHNYCKRQAQRSRWVGAAASIPSITPMTFATLRP